jgi:Homing endonuclease associated repeat
MPQKRRPQGGRSRRRPEEAGAARPPRPINAVRRIDPAKLAEFQAGIRKRYSDEDILGQLRGSAERLGRSPTMREFEDDSETTVHPQTVIQHFGSWNEAKRKAGLVPRRFAEPADLIRQLRELGEELGRPPTARDLDDHRESMPSKSLYWHMFGSLKNALREAGFDLPVGEERLERAIEQGVALARELGRLPKFADWKVARQKDSELMSEWQVYRMLEPRGGAARAGEAGMGSSGRRRQVGAWATFQYLVRERLLEEGTDVSPEGSLRGRRRSKPGAGGTSRPRAARARPAATPPRKSDRG